MLEVANGEYFEIIKLLEGKKYIKKSMSLIVLLQILKN